MLGLKPVLKPNLLIEQALRKEPPSRYLVEPALLRLYCEEPGNGTSRHGLPVRYCQGNNFRIPVNVVEYLYFQNQHLPSLPFPRSSSVEGYGDTSTSICIFTRSGVSGRFTCRGGVKAPLQLVSGVPINTENARAPAIGREP